MEMKYCPFCGEKGEVIEMSSELSGNLGNGTNISLPWSNTRKWYQPKCSKCECIINNGFSTTGGAIKEWNDRRSPAIEWLKKAAQLAEQQYNGGENQPLHTAWHWLHDNIEELLLEGGE